MTSHDWQYDEYRGRYICPDCGAVDGVEQECQCRGVSKDQKARVTNIGAVVPDHAAPDLTQRIGRIGLNDARQAESNRERALTREQIMAMAKDRPPAQSWFEEDFSELRQPVTADSQRRERFILEHNLSPMLGKIDL